MLGILTAAALVSAPMDIHRITDSSPESVRACWSTGTLSTEAQNAWVVVAFTIGSDGQIVQNSIRLVSHSNASEGAIKQAYQAARRAIIRCVGNGFSSTGKKTFTFGPNGSFKAVHPNPLIDV